MPASSTFEAICVRLTSAREQVAIVNVYRPGSEKPSAQFFDELTAVLETLVINSGPVVIGGDFNVQFQLAADIGPRHDVRRLSTDRRYRRARRHRLRENDLKSSDFAINRFFMKLFRT